MSFYPNVTDRSSQINLVNQECGYRNVWVENGDTTRWSNRGNLVVEHNWKGTEDVCRDGYVVSRNQPLRGSVPVPAPFPYYPQPYYPHHDHRDFDRHDHDRRPGVVIRF